MRSSRRTESASSPFVINLVQLSRQPGKRERFEVTAAAPDGCLLESAGVGASVIHLDIVFEFAASELVVTGRTNIGWSGPCRRCWETHEGHTRVDFREIFSATPIEGETYHLGEEAVDLEPMLREMILLNLPLAPICDSTCPGPDPKRFPTGATGALQSQPDDKRPARDPRWAVLDDLEFDI